MLRRSWAVLRERWAQLVNGGYRDRAERVACSRQVEATGGGEQALRQIAKQLCSAQLSIGLLINLLRCAFLMLR